MDKIQIMVVLEMVALCLHISQLIFTKPDENPDPYKKFFNQRRMGIFPLDKDCLIRSFCWSGCKDWSNYVFVDLDPDVNI